MSLAVVRRLLLAGLCLAAVFAPPALASPGLPLAPRSGPPTTSVILSGSGFAADDAVELFFDSIAVGSAHASAAGAFKASIKIPPSALPGNHEVGGGGGPAQRRR